MVRKQLLLRHLVKHLEVDPFSANAAALLPGALSLYLVLLVHRTAQKTLPFKDPQRRELQFRQLFKLVS